MGLIMSRRGKVATAAAFDGNGTILGGVMATKIHGGLAKLALGWIYHQAVPAEPLEESGGGPGVPLWMCGTQSP